MRMYDIIKNKRDNKELTNEEIKFFVKGYTDGNIPDYQASALTMAIFFNGMTEKETATLTLAMAESGDTVDLSEFGNKTVDKHSTGGVGDKTTLIVAPIVASLGCIIAKMSGRGLGHTGGTVDKLESIDGFNTSLSNEEFFEQVKNTGIAVVGQTGNLTPADKKLYSLRDVTATVDSIPLIASSIMSKKLAAGSHTIVLDVKCGSGAFMKTPEDAKALAEEMVKIGKNNNRNMAAIITDMNTPLGKNIGNSLEVIEAIEILKGNGAEDLKYVACALASEIVALSKNIDITEASQLVENTISSGEAFEKLKEWVTAQGGKKEWIENPDNFPKAKYSEDIFAENDCYMSSMNAEEIGISSVILGAGREKKDDLIDMTAGIILNKKTGDKIKKGDIIATLYTNNENSLKSAKEKFISAIEFSNEKPVEIPLIYEIVR
ncbi:MAG: pyrimidine-nucleoside phosphorylase [Ruminococcaceae bacterium]|nr:pyrimidine-nucleoside phosphorylase [Oscillospiraceae bacterium]